MNVEEKKKNTNYGSIFVYCFFCFVLVVEVARFTKPYYNLENLMETEAVVEEGFLGVEQSGILPCNFKRSSSVSVPARSHQKLSSIVRDYKRVRPPSSYCVKFQSYGAMAKMVKDNGDKYESRPFSVGGYNWTFLIYPNKEVPKGSSVSVSLYVRIDNSSFIANRNEVYAGIKFLAYESSKDTYYEYQETEAQRFHLLNQEYGVLSFLLSDYFINEQYGYVTSDGESGLGVDIVVYNPFEQWEYFSNQENIRDPLLDWRLTKFSTRILDSYTSDSFSSGGKDWVLKVYPNGAGPATGNSLSLFLLSASNEKEYVKAKFRVLNQNQTNNVEKQVGGWPNATENGWGIDNLIPLSDIRNATKGFLVDDTLKVQVEILSISKTDSY
ncbi:unnamed protein product [Thlaspi arvense]|uniref:MATH domain-containing protein n=1 Tax=Thlaspi arvense TaxID=13288 RepID=A0AAU9SJ22_THLAR|nr:unnamed protein product [Thlaspi arvense]